MRGVITAYSEAGKGTTFHVILPVTETEEIVSSGQEDNIPGGTERVMLVDDEEQIRKVVFQILSNAGYKVSIFEGRSGRSGRRAGEP